MAANAAVFAAPLALEEVFREHHSRVFQAAYRVTGNAGDAEDAMQTVFLRLAGRTPDAAPIANLEGYLRRAAVNAALDLVRARQDAAAVPLEVAEPFLPPDTRFLPDRQHNSDELRAALRRALSSLNAKAAEIFALRYFEGCGNGEIASMLGASYAEVAVSLHRSRARLELAMRDYLGDKS